MEDKKKKAKATPAATKGTAKKAANASTSEKTLTPKTKTATKKVTKAAEAPVTPEKPVAKTKKSAAAPIAEKKATTKKAAAPAVEAPEKPAAKAKKSAAAPIAEKKATSKKAATPAVAVPEKPAAKAKKSAAAPIAEKKATTKKAATPAVAAPEKPAAKAKKSAAAPIAEKKATSKKAATSTPAPEQPSAPKAKAAPKAKKAAPAETAAVITPAEEAKKVRTKPRRRELKRQGLWVPKHERGKHGKQQAADKGADPKAASKSKPSPASHSESIPKIGQQPTQKGKSAADAKLPSGKGKLAQPTAKADHKTKGGKDAKAAEAKTSKIVPDEFSEFVSRPSAKAERKNERREERAQKAEKDYNQSQGLFEEPIRLNRFVALSGVCSRRDADALIQAGKVKVNGKVVKEMGHKVQPGKDKVIYQDRELHIKVFVYLLMNKPKNRISTTDDELGRDTVMEIAERYTKARVYPVGRLDRNTTGLLLLTNDGDLTMKLTHPSSKFPKVYNVRLDRDIPDTDLQKLRKGFDLEDGFIKADKVERTSFELQNEIGIQIHSGANHIVKRMMAHLGYEVVTLDRVKLGPLTKKGLSRGTCRLLSEKEVGFLKML